MTEQDVNLAFNKLVDIQASTREIKQDIRSLRRDLRNLGLISIATFALLCFLAVGHAHAHENVTVNTYVQGPRWCSGLIMCLIQHQWDLEDRQAAAQPHACNVWNGRQYVRATCAP